MLQMRIPVTRTKIRNLNIAWRMQNHLFVKLNSEIRGWGIRVLAGLGITQACTHRDAEHILRPLNIARARELYIVAPC
jgi:hypothetical protein